MFKFRRVPRVLVNRKAAFSQDQTPSARRERHSPAQVNTTGTASDIHMHYLVFKILDAVPNGESIHFHSMVVPMKYSETSVSSTVAHQQERQTCGCSGEPAAFQVQL